MIIRILVILFGPIIIIFLFKSIYRLIENFVYNFKFTKKLEKIEPYLNEIKIDEIENNLIKLQRLNEEVNISLNRSFKMHINEKTDLSLSDFLPTLKNIKLSNRYKKRRRRKK